MRIGKWRTGEDRRQFKETVTKEGGKLVGEHQAELGALKIQYDTYKSKFDAASWEVDGLQDALDGVSAKITQLGSVDAGRRIDELSGEHQDLVVQTRGLKKEGEWEKGRLEVLSQYLDQQVARATAHASGDAAAERTAERALEALREKAVESVFKHAPIEKAADREFFRARWDKTISVLFKHDTDLKNNVLETATISATGPARDAAVQAELQRLSQGYFEEAFDDYIRQVKIGFYTKDKAAHPEKYPPTDDTKGFWGHAAGSFKKRVLPGAGVGAVYAGADVGARALERVTGWSWIRKTVSIGMGAAIGAYSALRGREMRDGQTDAMIEELRAQGNENLDGIMGAGWEEQKMGTRWGMVLNEAQKRRGDLKKWRNCVEANGAILAPAKNELYRLIELTGQSRLTEPEIRERRLLIDSKKAEIETAIKEVYASELSAIEDPAIGGAIPPEDQVKWRCKVMLNMQEAMNRLTADVVAQECISGSQNQSMWDKTYKRLEGIATGREQSGVVTTAFAGAAVGVVNSWYRLLDQGGGLVGALWGVKRSLDAALARQSARMQEMPTSADPTKPAPRDVVKPAPLLLQEVTNLASKPIPEFSLAAGHPNLGDAANATVKANYEACKAIVIEARARIQLPDVREPERVAIERQIAVIEKKINHLRYQERFLRASGPVANRTEQMLNEVFADTTAGRSAVSAKRDELLRRFGLTGASKEKTHKMLWHLLKNERAKFWQVMGDVFGGMAGGLAGGFAGGAAVHFEAQFAGAQLDYVLDKLDIKQENTPLPQATIPATPSSPNPTPPSAALSPKPPLEPLPQSAYVEPGKGEGITHALVDQMMEKGVSRHEAIDQAAYLTIKHDDLNIYDPETHRELTLDEVKQLRASLSWREIYNTYEIRETGVKEGYYVLTGADPGHWDYVESHPGETAAIHAPGEIEQGSEYAIHRVPVGTADVDGASGSNISNTPAPLFTLPPSSQHSDTPSLLEASMLDDLEDLPEKSLVGVVNAQVNAFAEELGTKQQIQGGEVLFRDINGNKIDWGNAEQLVPDHGYSANYLDALHHRFDDMQHAIDRMKEIVAQSPHSQASHQMGHLQVMETRLHHAMDALEAKQDALGALQKSMQGEGAKFEYKNDAVKGMKGEATAEQIGAWRDMAPAGSAERAYLESKLPVPAPMPHASHSAGDTSAADQPAPSPAESRMGGVKPESIKTGAANQQGVTIDAKEGTVTVPKGAEVAGLMLQVGI